MRGMRISTKVEKKITFLKKNKAFTLLYFTLLSLEIDITFKSMMKINSALIYTHSYKNVLSFDSRK